MLGAPSGSPAGEHRATDVQEQLGSELAGVERLIAGISDEVDVPLLGQLLRHILRPPGKRLRPRLAFLSSRLGHANVRTVTLLGTAVELLHTASLIHDDLVDESATRRGAPTLHQIASPKATILVGDYLFAKSAALATATDSLAVMALFARTLMAICDGELREVANAEAGDLSREQYFRRIEGKTASLFVAATEGGAILADLRSDGIEAMRQYGLNLGMAFQIADDVLDLTGSVEVLGKPVGSDLRQGTITLPVLWAIENLSDPLIGAAVAGEITAPSLFDQAIARIAGSAAIDHAMGEAMRYAGRAREALSAFPHGEARRTLELMADYSAQRHR